LAASGKGMGNRQSGFLRVDATARNTLALGQSIGPPGRTGFARRRVFAEITDPPTLPAGQDRRAPARLVRCLCVQVALHGSARHSQGCCNLRIVQALASQRKSAGGIGLPASGPDTLRCDWQRRFRRLAVPALSVAPFRQQRIERWQSSSRRVRQSQVVASR